MSLIDQERFYKCLIDSRLEKVVFPQQDETCESYFENSEAQLELSVYGPENMDDVRCMVDSILTGEGYEEIKKECMRATLENIIAYEQEGIVKTKKNKEIAVPEFIYNF